MPLRYNIVSLDSSLLTAGDNDK